MVWSEQQPDRRGFAERIRLQLRSRYPEAAVEIDEQRFALQLVAPGVDTTLPLVPLYNACAREPQRAPAIIAQYVTSLERQLTPRSNVGLSLNRVLWCVRSREYITGLRRSDELLSVDLASDLVAFVAEDLPGSIMRGVPRDEWRGMGIDDDAVRDAAQSHTEARFARLASRIKAAERIPADGWRLSGDPVYQTSIVMVQAVLMAFVERSRGDVLLGFPDRSMVLAIPASQPNAARFSRRVLLEWREAMHPCSRDVFVTDGRTLRRLQRHSARAGAAVVLPWLED